MQEAGIPINFIVGCSVGAFIGAIYASGGVKELKKYAIEMEGESIFSFSDLNLFRPGLLDGDKKLRQLFCMHSDKKYFSELALPLKVVAADICSGDKVILDSGDLLTALRASMSYPGLFAPVHHKGRWLVDGGVLDPVPVGVARSMGADIVVAVNLDSKLESRTRRHAGAQTQPRNVIQRRINEKPTAPGTRMVIMSSIQLMQNRITRVNFAVDPPDIMITPRLGGVRMLDFDQVENVIEEGYIAAQHKVSDIEMLLNRIT